MKYKNQQYAFVNQKEIDGKIVTAYRCISEPTKEIIEIDGEIKETKIQDIWQ